MLANTYRGEVPTSPNMIPMALHSITGPCTQSSAAGQPISTLKRELSPSEPRCTMSLGVHQDVCSGALLLLQHFARQNPGSNSSAVGSQ